MASLIGLSEEAYTEAFTRHFKRTISFLHIKYRVPTAEAAEEYALEGWATVWQYRERFDPAKSSIETYANMCCFQAMVKRRKTLWARADIISIERFRKSNDGERRDWVPSALRSEMDEERLTRLDAELVLASCREQDSRVLRRYYLQELPVPRTSLSRARTRARECVLRSQS